MGPKRIKVPLKEWKPTEYMIPQDKLDEIAEHYDGTPESMKDARVVGKPGQWYGENGNKRALFLKTKGHDYIWAWAEDGEEQPDDLEDCRSLAKQAEEHGVNTLEDLKDKIVSRAEFERKMKRR
ncbi:hypothetical protein ACFL96_04645 [Thermoproteota archaeon]